MSPISHMRSLNITTSFGMYLYAALPIGDFGDGGDPMMDERRHELERVVPKDQENLVSGYIAQLGNKVTPSLYRIYHIITLVQHILRRESFYITAASCAGIL
jgi:hypothetical protein